MTAYSVQSYVKSLVFYVFSDIAEILKLLENARLSPKLRNTLEGGRMATGGGGGGEGGGGAEMPGDYVASIVSSIHQT